MAKEKKKKGSYGKVLGFCVIVGCVAAFLAWFGGDFGWPFGLGDSGSGSNGNGSGYTAENDYPAVQDNGPSAGNDTGDTYTEPELLIRIAGNTIYHGEQEITIGELAQILDELNQPGFVWELRDEQAIMETYENVKALLVENDIGFTETR